jgi:exodeoxyribonuclease VII large subunit
MASAAHSLAAATTEHLRSRSSRLSALAGRLNALSPLATLERGFAVARDANGRTLASVADFKARMKFTLRLRDGEVDGVAGARRPAGEPGQ